ncbi:hypothetical protein OROGR_004099 [Orobanche gracilis]
MQIENASKKPGPRSLLHNNTVLKCANRAFDMPSSEAVYCATGKEKERSLFPKMLKKFFMKGSGLKVTEINGTESGVAFFLHLSVHASKKDEKDTRILPVHYSDNYFSLVPGEVMSVSLTFEVSQGTTPYVMIHGWNYQGGYTVL